MEKLQKGNNNLRYENQELKRKHHNLINYISKTFEVVKHLFDFPIDIFKKLVNNFIKAFDKNM